MRSGRLKASSWELAEMQQAHEKSARARHGKERRRRPRRNLEAYAPMPKLNVRPPENCFNPDNSLTRPFQEFLRNQMDKIYRHFGLPQKSPTPTRKAQKETTETLSRTATTLAVSRGKL